MGEREYSEAEKAQAKVRLVRVDAEGNPVGVGEPWSFSRFDMVYLNPATEPHPLDAQILRALRVKQVSLKEMTVSEEMARLLRGESGDPSAADDSGSDPLDR